MSPLEKEKIALPERLAKKDASGKLYKSVTENKLHFNKEDIFVVSKRRMVN